MQNAMDGSISKDARKIMNRGMQKRESNCLIRHVNWSITRKFLAHFYFSGFVRNRKGCPLKADDKVSVVNQLCIHDVTERVSDLISFHAKIQSWLEFWGKWLSSDIIRGDSVPSRTDKEPSS